MHAWDDRWPEGMDLQLARDGDREAMNRLLRRHKDLAYSIALKYVGNGRDAEDIVQEAFVNVFLHIRQFRNESAFTTWLYTIIYREVLRQAKRSRPWVSIQEEALDSYGLSPAPVFGSERPDGTGRLERAGRLDCIREGMQQLAASEYLVIQLFYLAEKGIREIAAVTGLSPANVRVLLHRARKKLAAYFERRGIKSTDL